MADPPPAPTWTADAADLRRAPSVVPPELREHTDTCAALEKQGPPAPEDYACDGETQITSDHVERCKRMASPRKRKLCESVMRRDGPWSNRKLHCVRNGVKHGAYFHVVRDRVLEVGMYREGAVAGQWLEWSERGKLLSIKSPDGEIPCDLLVDEEHLERAICHDRAFEIEQEQPELSEQQLRIRLSRRCRQLIRR